MAIEWDKIEGFNEGMSADEKLALLEKQPNTSASADPPPTETQKADPKTDKKADSTPDPAPARDAGKVIAKTQFDKLASELAAAKKQLRAKMSEDEARELDRQQAEESMKSELEILRKEKSVSEYKSSLLALGFDEQLAMNSANALTDGDFDAVFADMKKHIVGLEKSLRASILKETPVPPAGDNADKPEDSFIKAFKEG